jgi:plastocyanin
VSAIHSPALLVALLTLVSACGDVKTPTDPTGPGGAEIVVELRSDLTFSPAVRAVRVGDTVTWRNTGGLHNVVADDGSFRCATGCDGVGGGNGAPSSTAWSFSRTFTTLGNVNYYCEVHGAPGGRGMAGTIQVVAR